MDEDTRAFNRIMEAFGLPKGNDAEAAIRKHAIQSATKNAIEIPFRVMETALRSMEVIKTMVAIGNPASVTDAGVGALCARTAVIGAFLNVKVNSNDLDDKQFVGDVLQKAKEIVREAEENEREILAMVEQRLSK